MSSSKSSSSLDVIDMDSKLLKLAAKQIAPSLSYLFNLSLSMGMIPEDFKLARVTPIFKGKGDPTVMGELSILSKNFRKSCKITINELSYRT